MHTPTDGARNQRRRETNRRNRRKRKGLTPAGREKLRQTALKHQPWRFSTGPRTPEGKAKVALNGKKQQRDELSIREISREVGEAGNMVDCLAAARQQALDAIR